MSYIKDSNLNKRHLSTWYVLYKEFIKDYNVFRWRHYRVAQLDLLIFESLGSLSSKLVTNIEVPFNGNPSGPLIESLLSVVLF